MKKLLVILGLLVGVSVLAKVLGPKMNVDWETRFERMPDNAPPKWMFRNISAIRENTDQILELVQRGEFAVDGRRRPATGRAMKFAAVSPIGRATVAALVVAGGLFSGASVASAVAGGTIAVSPSTPVKGGQTITLKGSGWEPNAEVGWCQGVPAPAGQASQAYCNGGLYSTGTADATGHFSGTVRLARFVTIPAFSHTFDCGDPAVTCTVGAADRADVAGTAIGLRLKFAPIRPTIVPHSGSVLEGNSGTSIVKLPVTLSEPPIQPVTVRWNTLYVPGAAGAQADPATDYTPASGSITFPRGKTTASVSISVKGDTLVEPDEYIVVSLNHAVNAWLGGYYGLGFGVITNDDTAP